MRAGIGEIFIEVVLGVRKKYKIALESAHLDGTSFQVHGEYKESEKEAEKEEPKTIIITKGYSRDHRPDLKQYTMELICSPDGEVPVWMKIGDGNEVEQKEYAKTIKNFKSCMDFQGIMVADAALYTQENLQNLEGIHWLSRVPLTIKSAKKLVSEIEEESLIASEQEGYKYREIVKTYGTIEQRWLIVESQKRKESDLEKLSKKIAKEKKEAEKQLKELKKQEFACEVDALRAANKLLKKSKYHQLTYIHPSVLTPKKSQDNPKCSVQIEAMVSPCPEKINPLKKRAGRFILATNVWNHKILSSEKMLRTYKQDQQSVERGFRFLKDPMFFTDSVFLKSPQRIEALGLIMALSLLVYKLAERQLRQTLKRKKAAIKNQLGKHTARPTLRWIFQCFQAIHVYIEGGIPKISNLTQERLFMLKFFPPACQRYYLDVA